VIIHQRLISAELRKKFANIADDANWISAPTCMLSVLDNQLLVARQRLLSRDALIFYNTSTSSRIASVDMKRFYLDAAWISPSSIICITRSDIELMSIPGYSSRVVYSIENDKIESVSVIRQPTVVVYVSFGYQGVLMSVDEGITWSNVAHLQPRDGWASYQAISVPHTNAVWTLEYLNKTMYRVCIIQGQGQSHTVISQLTVIRSWQHPRLQYDGKYSVLVTGWLDNAISVFDINGNHQGKLNITGIVLLSKRNTPRIDIDSSKSLMYMGTSDDTVSVIDLKYEVV
jgi:hypothetical protein